MVPVSVTEVIGVVEVNPINAVPVNAGVTTDPVEPPALRFTVSVPAPVISLVRTSKSTSPNAVTPPLGVVIVVAPLVTL